MHRIRVKWLFLKKVTQLRLKNHTIFDGKESLYFEGNLAGLFLENNLILSYLLLNG